MLLPFPLCFFRHSSSPLRAWPAWTVRQAALLQQREKPRIAADRGQTRIDRQVSHDAFILLVRPGEPLDRAIVIAEPDVDVCDEVRVHLAAGRTGEEPVEHLRGGCRITGQGVAI